MDSTKLIFACLMALFISRAGNTQSSVGINLGIAPYQNVMITYEYAALHCGVRPFVVLPMLPGRSDKLGAGIDLRWYSCGISIKHRWWAGISPSIWRTDKYKTPYKSLGKTPVPVYSAFICVGINLYPGEKIIIGIGGAAGISGWKIANTTFGWLAGRPE